MDDDGRFSMDPGFDVRSAIENLRKIIVQEDKLPDDCDALRAAEHAHDVREQTNEFMASVRVEVAGKLERDQIVGVKKCKACGAKDVILLLDDFLHQQEAYRINHELAATAAELLRNLRPAIEKYTESYTQYEPDATRIHERASKYFNGKHDHQRCCEDPRLALEYLGLSRTKLESVTITAKKGAFYDEISRQPGLRPVKQLLSEAELILHEHGFTDSEIAKIMPDDLGDHGRKNRIQNRRYSLRKRISKSSLK